MNLFRVNFDELYRRHLCRHGHFGINLLHLLAVIGIYVAIFGIVGAVVRRYSPESELQTLLLLTAPWFLVVACNVPLQVTLFTGLFVVALLGLYSALPLIPVWAWAIWIIGMHRFQQWSHNVYHMKRDMSEFDEKYRKGFTLFVLLLVYELPILLNYLLFGRSDWVRGSQPVVTAEES